MASLTGQMQRQHTPTQQVAIRTFKVDLTSAIKLRKEGEEEPNVVSSAFNTKESNESCGMKNM